MGMKMKEKVKFKTETVNFEVKLNVPKQSRSVWLAGAVSEIKIAIEQAAKKWNSIFENERDEKAKH